MAAPNLTPAFALAPGAEELLPLLEELAVLEKRNGGLRPENVRKVIDAVAPFVEKRRSSVLDCGAPLSDLQEEDFQKYRQVMVACLDDDERAACAKMSAGVKRPSSSAPPAVKSHNGHETQLRDEGGRWRASLFRRVVNAQPKLEGSRFFR